MQKTKMTEEQCALVENNVKHAYWLAHRWFRTNKEIPLDELISLALFGLTKASATYNPEKKTKFSTYSRFVIENEFRDELRKVRRCSVGVYEDDEVIQPIDDFLDDVVATDETEELHAAIQSLPERNKRMVMAFYADGLSQREIAKRENTSQYTVCTVIAQSRELIAEMLNS